MELEVGGWSSEVGGWSSEELQVTTGGWRLKPEVGGWSSEVGGWSSGELQVEAGGWSSVGRCQSLSSQWVVVI